MMKKGWILAAAAAIVASLAVVSSASAQYPTPRGNLVCTTTVRVEIKEAYVSATLTDGSGKAMTNAWVDFWIDSGSGTLSASSAVTNASGVATVTVSNAGNTVVAAGYDGLQCRSVAQVLGQTFRPPSTGDGGLVGGGTSNAMLGAGLAVMGLGGVALMVLRHRRLAAVEER